MDDQFDAAAHVSPNSVAILALRGHFSLPTFQEPEQGTRPPLYLVYDAYPLTKKEALLVTNNGAGLIDLEQHTFLWTITCPAEGAVLNLTIPLLALSRDRLVFLWDLRLGRMAQTIELGAQAEGVTDLAMSSDGALIAVARFGMGVELWRVIDGVLFQRLEGVTDYRTAWSVAFSPDGRLVATGNYDGDAVWLWRVADGQLLQQLEEHPSRGRVAGLAFSPDGRLLLSGSEDATVRLWEVETGRVQRVYQEPQDAARSVLPNAAATSR